jgi:hypothetical protein
MPIDTKYNQDISINYSFDDTKIEFIGGISKLLAQSSPPEAYLYAKLDENQGLVATDSSGNNRHGSFQGGLDITAWTTGKINSAIQGDSNGYINFDGFGSFERTQAFSVECWVKFTSAGTQGFVGRQINSGAFQGYIINSAAGKIRWVARDTNSQKITLESNATYNDGVWHHVVGTYDGSSLHTGAMLYIDNAVNFTYTDSDVLTGSLVTTANLQISGRDGGNIPLLTGSSIDEVLVYERDLTAAGVSFRWNGGAGTQTIPGATTSFPIDNPTMTPFSSAIATALINFDAGITATGSDDVFFVVTINGQDMYWDGAVWSNSTGYPNVNTLSDIQANISTLISSRAVVALKWFYHSDDGSTTPELSFVTLFFNFEAGAAIPNKTEVVGIQYDQEGNPDQSPIRVGLNVNGVEYATTDQVNSMSSIIYPDTLGNWSIFLVDTDNLELGSKYTFTFKSAETSDKTVPATSQINFNDLPDA